MKKRVVQVEIKRGMLQGDVFLQVLWYYCLAFLEK